MTICHSKTKGLDEKLKNADLIVTAVGDRERLILTQDMVKNDAVVIDVGITRDNGKLMGDVDFHAVREKVSWITPVPGGVGPMTVSMLLKNTISARAFVYKRRRVWINRSEIKVIMIKSTIRKRILEKRNSLSNIEISNNSM